MEIPVYVEVETATQDTKIRAVQTALEKKNRNTLAWKATVSTPSMGSIAAPCLPPPLRLTVQCASQPCRNATPDTPPLGPTVMMHSATGLDNIRPHHQPMDPWIRAPAADISCWTGCLCLAPLSPAKVASSTRQA